MEKLAGDLSFGSKFVKLPILPTLFIDCVQGRLGELRSGYLGLKGLTPILHKKNHLSLLGDSDEGFRVLGSCFPSER